MQTKAFQRDRGNVLILATACMAIALWAAGCGGGGSTAVVPVSTAGFSVSVTNVSFGNQAVGTTSASQTAILINVGTATLTFSSIQVTGPNAGDYTLTNTCGASLAPQAQCSVSLTFTPSAAGTRTASVVFTDNAAGSPQTVNVTGMGTSAGVGLSASTLTFGSQLINTSTPAQTVTLTNNGNSTLTTAITVAGANAGDFSEGDNCGGSVAAQASCTISVAFKPTVASPENALLTITDNAPGSPQTVTLTGTGTSPTATPNPPNLAFSTTQTIGMTTAPLPVTLTNTGNATLSVTSAAITGNNVTDFAVTANTCSLSVAANGGFCTISVTFTPTATGNRSASLTIADNAPNSPQTVPLTGAGVGNAAVAGLSTTSLTFGSQSVGTSSGALTVVLSNTGSIPLTPAITVTGANAGDFNESDNCGGSVAANNGSCTISVTFKPTLNSTENAALTITDNAANSPQMVNLSGTGTSSQVSLSASTLTFVSQPVNTTSAAQAVTLTNTGNASLTGVSIAITGTNSGDYGQNNNCGSSVAPNGGTCTINVTFTPSAIGARVAMVAITDNAMGSPQTVNLTGTGGGPAVNLTATSLTFSSQTLGTTSPVQAVTLSNQGNANLAITSIAVSGANAGDFVETSTCPIGSGAVPATDSCTISVTFKPSVPSAESATVTITDNAQGSPQTIGLTGAGSGPVTGLSALSLSYNSQPVGSTSGSQSVTLTNSGNANLTGVNVAITGANSSDFAETSSTCGTVVPNSNCSISVNFTPTAPGARTASLTITDNAASSPQTVNLTGTGSGPTASPSPGSLTFNSQNVGTTSPAQTVTLSNTGNASLSIASFQVTGTNAGDFPVSSPCGGSLLANTSCTFSITFTPTGSGTRTATLTFTDNANNVTGSTQTVSLTGMGTGATVSLNPSSLSFGSQNQGTTSTAQSITLTNTGDANLTIASVSVTGTNPGDFAQNNNCGSLVAANASCTINVTFKPTTSGSRAASISITDNGFGSPQTAPLTGTGLAGQISLSPSSLTFTSQNVGTTSTAQSFTVTNTGNTTFTISSISVAGANPGDFSETDSCGSSLAQNASCTVVVKFSPTAPGARTATVSIADSLTGSPQTVALTGTGSGPAVNLSAGSVTFTTQNLGTPSASQSVTLTNTGNASLTLASISVTGTDPGDYALTTTGNSCPYTGGTEAANGGFCTINVTFKPGGIGSRPAVVSITDNAVGSPQTVNLTGTGSAPIANVPTTSLTFTSQNLGTTSASQTITLNNTGNAALTISGTTFTGPNATEFAVSANTCGSSVAANSSCTINVTFTPTATGTQTASLNITDNSNYVAGTQQVVNLTGTGTGPVVSLSPSPLSFGSQTVGIPSTVQSITLTNTGNASLTITGISVTGANAADFTLSSPAGSCPYTGGSVAASGGFCTINVTFKPTLASTENAAVTITDNAANSPQSVPITGTGTASIVSLSPASVNFGNQGVNTPSQPQTITLTDTGNVSLTLASISVTGTNAGDFVLSSPAGSCPYTGGSVAANNGNCTITVTFTPSASGTRNATITIQDNATAGSPQAVNLVGTGAVGSVGLSATILTFGSQSVPTPSAVQVVILTNGGSSALTFSSIPTITGTNAGEFAISSNTCLPANPLPALTGTCTVGVTFTPTTAGSATATLNFTDNATNSPQMVNLTGTGTAPEATLTSTLTFGSTLQPVPVLTPYTGGPQPVTLQNTGNAIMNLASPAISGANAADFSIATTTCGTTLAAGSNCQIMITYAPTAYPSGGTSLGTLTVTDNNNNVANSTQTVSLNGTAAHDIVLSWTASPTAGVTYNVYRGTSSGNENTATPLSCITTTLNTASTPGCADADPTLVPGTPYFYVVTAVGSGQIQSAKSNEASAVAK